MAGAGATLEKLRALLREIDGRGYGAYKRIAGRWAGEGLVLFIDHVQGDPFAQPSRLRLKIDTSRHGIPRELWNDPPRRLAAADRLLRLFARAASQEASRVRAGSGRSGQVLVDSGGAEVLARSGCDICPEGLELRFRVGLPARGRTVLGRQAAELLCKALPAAASKVCWENIERHEFRRFVELVEDHHHLQGLLAERGLVAFVRDGSILPRATGASSAPLDRAVPFESPPELRVTLPTLHHGEVTGMGITEGITLITGGGFHGKTTLLEAIQAGIYPHVPGDGREWVVTVPSAVKVRSEDGRAITGVDISAFVRSLPQGKDTRRFTTEDASGSTSLAAAVAEAIEMGATALLLDEDTCATNLLVRDARMQKLVQKETLVPFIDRVAELRDRMGVSVVLVAGGLGDYLEVADRVLLLEDYRCKDATGRARQIAGQLPSGRSPEPGSEPFRPTRRVPLAVSFDPRRSGDRRGKVRARGLRELSFGKDTVDLDAVEQLVDDSQVRAIGVLLERLAKFADGKNATLSDCVRAAIDEAAKKGLYSLAPLPELAMVRVFELAAAASRLRGLAVAS